MKLLLRRDITNLGLAGDVVDVKEGYARNYLIPQNLGVLPTSANMKKVEEDKRLAEQERKARRSALESKASRLRDVEVTISAACNPEGHLYGSVGPREVAAALRDEGHDVEPKQVQLHEPIRQLDTVPVPVVFADDLTVEVKVWVVRETGSGDLEELQEAEQTEEPTGMEAEHDDPGTGVDALDTDIYAGHDVAITSNRIPPHDLEAEMSLLGSMMLDREAIGDVLPIIHKNESDRFYRPDHRKIFEVLVDIYDRGDPVDLTIVRNELDRRGLLEEIGGVDYVIQLAESVPSHLHAEHYARLVRDKAMLRDLIGAVARITDDAYSHTEEAKDILDRAEQALFHVTDQRISEQATPIRDYIYEIFDQISSREGHYITGLPTGYFELDDLLSGMQNGEMMIIAARPSMGKTAFGLNVAENVAANSGKPAAFFSLEMSKQAIAQRLLCSRGKVDSHKLRRGMLTQGEIDSLHAVCDELTNMPLFIDDTPGMSVLELRAKSRRLRMQHDISCVFVDYLQLMHNPGRIESRQQEVSEISRGLKALARELNVPVVVLAQLNRNPEGRTDNRPRMSDLRESGAIEQDADVIMLLHREEYYKGESTPQELRGIAEVILAKQRNGPTGTIQLVFNQKYTRFENLAINSGHTYVPDDGYTSAEEYDTDAPAPF